MPEFQNEMMYQTTMSIVRKMLREGLISEEEYRQIDTMFIEKYRPKFGTLLSEISLTSRPFRVNMVAERSGNIAKNQQN